MNVLFWGRCDFPKSFSGKDMSRNVEIVANEVLWSVRWSYEKKTKTIWGPLLPNVTRHSGRWPYTVTPSIDSKLHQFLTVTDLDLITEFDWLPTAPTSLNFTARFLLINELKAFLKILKTGEMGKFWTLGAFKIFKALSFHNSESKFSLSNLCQRFHSFQNFASD